MSKFRILSIIALILSTLFVGCDGCSGVYVIPGAEFGAPDGGIVVDANKQQPDATDKTPKPDAVKEKHRISLVTPGAGGTVPQGSSEVLSASYRVESATPDNPLTGFTVACNQPGKGFGTSSPCPAIQNGIRVSCGAPGAYKWFTGALNAEGIWSVTGMNCSSPNGGVEIQLAFDVKKNAQIGEEFRLGIFDNRHNVYYETEGQERVPAFKVSCGLATRNDLVREAYHLRRYTMCSDPINRPVPICPDIKDPELSCMWSVLAAKGMLQPRPDGTCGGEETFNRAAMAKVIWESLRYEKPQYLMGWKTGYDDVTDPTYWYYDYVALMGRFALHQVERNYRPGDVTTMCELQRSMRDYMSPIFWEVKEVTTVTKISASRTEHFLATYNVYRATKKNLPAFKVLCSNDDFSTVDTACPVTGIYFTCSVDGQRIGGVWKNNFSNGLLNMPNGFECGHIDGRVQVELRFDIAKDATPGTKFRLGVSGGAYGQVQLPTFEVGDDGRTGTVTVEQTGCIGIVRLKGPHGLSTDIQTNAYTARLPVGNYELDIIATAPNCGLDKVVDGNGNPLSTPYQQVLTSGKQITFRVIWNTAP